MFVCTKRLSYSALFNVWSLTEGIAQYHKTPATVIKHQKNAAAVSGSLYILYMIKKLYSMNFLLKHYITVLFKSYFPIYHPFIFLKAIFLKLVNISAAVFRSN